MALPWLEVLGRWLFLGGALLMVTGDAPPSLPYLSWVWLYLICFGASFACLAAAGRLYPLQSTVVRGCRLPVAFVLFAFLVSTVFSQAPRLSAEAFGLVVGILAFCWLAAAALEDDRTQAALWIAVAVAIALLAVRVIWWRLEEGLDVAAFQLLNNAWLGKLQLSWVFDLWAPFLLARVFTEPRQPVRALHAAAWALSGAATYVLFSRMGMAVFALTTLAVCLGGRIHWRRWLPMLATAVVGAAVLFAVSASMTAFVVETFVDLDRNPGVAMRLGVFREALRLFAEHPITGIGLGTFDDIAYALPGSTANLDFFRNGWHAHNVFLHVLTETGVLGLAAWCLLWYAVLATLLRAWRAAGTGRVLVAAALSSVAAFLTLSLTEVLIAARAHASLRMNLTLGLAVVLGLHLAQRAMPIDHAPRR